MNIVPSTPITIIAAGQPQGVLFIKIFGWSLFSIDFSLLILLPSPILIKPSAEKLLKFNVYFKGASSLAASIISYMNINIKRIYDESSADDGFRVLVDRLWPRGISKQRAKLDLWLKDVAPSTELRQWFSHDPAKFKEFSGRYQLELDNNPSLVELKDIVKKHGKVTLLYGAKDPKLNQAAVLKDYLDK